MSLITLITVLGWVGAVAGIVAYGMVSKGRWGAGSFAFQLTNLGGATAMFLVAAVNGVWPSAAANVAWIVIGAHATLTILRKRHQERAAARRAAFDLAA
ncbi:hypothetical protein DNL40_09435 [Xylanimonas oleitrophica]|uniref:CBU-0592-like domain-containing protein n=1 Tax=Xylanimonas oleitrophica TaxID=2607479 RepID=A0A2W5WP77_9MICO|nr:hypothetical protein [Xylanimonas oleitrophica]PZR53197.1 hypothetical protein DNL40_09435 [Xylanimonas oleitrophica]